MYKRSPLEKRLRLRGNTWHFWGYDYTGTRYEVSTHQSDEVAARKAARKIEAERATPPADPTPDQAAKQVTLGDALGLLAAHDARVGAARNTVEFHVDRGGHLIRLLGVDVKFSELSSLNAYTDTRLAEGAGRHTIQKEHRVLRQAAKLAGIDTKRFIVDGFRKATGTRGFYKPGNVWLERAVYIDALLAQTSSNPDKHRVDRRDDISVYVNLGVRRREILAICSEHVDLRKNTVRVKGTKTDEADRVLPLNGAMRVLFARRIKGQSPGVPLFADWGSGNRDLRANWRRARATLIKSARSKSDRADLDATLPKSLTFNDLRRTFCSLMKNAGVSLEDCADLLGHGDMAMVKLVYGHTAMATLHAAVAKLPELAPLPERERRTQKLSRRQRQRLRKEARESVARTVAVSGGNTKSTENRV